MELTGLKRKTIFWKIRTKEFRLKIAEDIVLDKGTMPIQMGRTVALFQTHIRPPVRRVFTKKNIIKKNIKSL